MIGKYSKLVRSLPIRAQVRTFSKQPDTTTESSATSDSDADSGPYKKIKNIIDPYKH